MAEKKPKKKTENNEVTEVAVPEEIAQATIDAAQESKKKEAKAKETQTQKDKLSTVIEKAQSMAEDSNVVAQRLNESVDAMVESSSQTQEKVADINNAINEQNRIREETAAAIDKLTNFLKEISSEFENTKKTE